MIRTRRFHTTTFAALASASLVLAACGGGDESSPEAGDSDTATEQTDAGGQTDATEAPDSEATMPELPATDTDAGTCQVDVTGDVERSFTAGGGMSAVNTDYWLTPAQKEVFGEGFYFIVNCQGEGDDYFGLLAGTTGNADTIPYGPGTYELAPTDAIFGGAGDGPFTIMLAFDGDEGVWGVAEAGTVEITEFDDDNIAGTVTFGAADVLADMAGTPERSAQVTVSFDFDNPN